eukprot:scaffold8259_cov143-Cylindrotheca_fusiformis.AAC.1
MASILPLAAPAAAFPPNTSPAPQAEDQAGEGGESIATFASYKPSALPKLVVDILNGKGSLPQKQQESSEPEIIDLIDDQNGAAVRDLDLSTIAGQNSRSDDNVPELECPSHTSLACESALLASVRAPMVAASTAACLLDLAKTKALSPLQLESVLLAIQRHRRIFSGNIRAGFFIGDGAGVGKGRQIAAIIRNSLCRKNHTKRHVWLSVSRELAQDAKRDLKAVGVYCDVHDGTELLDKSNGLGIPNKGVLFCTYQLLVSKKRIEQIVSWCAGIDSTKKKSLHQQLEQNYNGCIMLDEAHKAKNLKEDTRTAKLVIELQRRLPNARVVYCSATGVSDVGHMVYAERLGLWRTSGHQKNFSLFESFPMFQKSLERRGLGSLEMLALEMKQQGSFMARTLSWDGAEFETLEIPLDTHQRQVYDEAAAWWTFLKESLELALDIPLMRLNPPNKMIWRTFWSAHQRFFRELTVCAKIPHLAQDAKRMAAKGCSIIFGLQTTGDSSMQSILEQYRKEEQFPGLLSSAKATMVNFVQNHFPVAPGNPEPPIVPVQPNSNASLEDQRRYILIQREAERISSLPAPLPIPELVARRAELLDRIQSIDLPPNPLDDLINRLGGIDQVSEMTGRPGRIVRRSSKYFVYSKRCTEDANDRINLVEKRKFMDGIKPFAIISDAASTGISLHAAQGSGASHKRRIHYTIELPWSADKAVQQLGRSHRSAQESAPVYKLVVTDLGGERRFAAAVSKRMASLGALTKGDRRAATGSDMLSDFDLDSRYGKQALKRFYNALSTVATSSCNDNIERVVMPSRNTEEILDDFYVRQVHVSDPAVMKLSPILTLRRSAILAIICDDLETIGLNSEAQKQSFDVKVFLNRIFGLPVARQSLAFSVFMSTLDDVVSEAKLSGDFEGSVEDIKASSIEIAEDRVLATDPSCGAETKFTTLLLDRGISLDGVCNIAKEEALTQFDIAASQVKKILKPEECTMEKIEVDDPRSKLTNRNIAQAGFYISRKKIAGRELVLFARARFPDSSFKNSAEAMSFDPLGLMVVTRPNTGTNPCEMPSRDLKVKYRLVFSCEEFRRLLHTTESDHETVGQETLSLPNAIGNANPQLTKQWNSAFAESNFFEHKNGLAPRLSRVGLITGAVLHILPTLEKIVILRTSKERSLRIMRAEVPLSPNSTRQLVGVRFPTDDDALQRLELEMALFLKAQAVSGGAFHDEALGQVCQSSTKWATTAPKTMQSFFKVVPKHPTGNVRKAGDNSRTQSHLALPQNSSTRTKRISTDVAKAASASSNKKHRSISSFFSMN